MTTRTTKTPADRPRTPACRSTALLGGAILGLAAIAGCGTPWASGPSAPAATTTKRAAANPTSSTRADDRPKAGTTAQHHDHQGVSVAFELLPVRPGDRPPGEAREGDDVLFRFTLTDTSSGVGLTNTHPAAWLIPRPSGEGRDAFSAAKTIARLVRGDRLFRPSLDLNAFYALTMNDDATVTVVDPRFGFGNTKLLAMVRLKGEAVDWSLDEARSRLYIATPSADRIAVIDTTSWSEVTAIHPLRHPTRLALQPDGHYLWAAYGAPGDRAGESGVAAIDAEGARVARLIPTGPGAHEIAFDRDGRRAFVTNRDGGTVSVIDVRTLSKVADLATGPTPASISHSDASGLVYVAHEEDGSIAILDPESTSIVGRARARPGIAQIRFAPGGRFGFVVNPREDEVSILDTAAGRIVQTADTEPGPDQVSFSDRMTYVRHRDSPNVRIIPLDGVGAEGRPLSVVDFPAGRAAPSSRPATPSLGASIVQAAGEEAVLVSNPADRVIYYYKEGMAAPMGSFSNYGRIPRAVLCVDRSLRERRPGVYETVARLGVPGTFNLAFLLDSPRITHYFEVDVRREPDKAAKAGPATIVEPIDAPRDPAPGVSARVRIRLTDRASGSPIDGLADVTVLAFSPGGWQRRAPAKPEGHGVYATDLVPPRPGTYYLYAEVPSAGVLLNQNWFHTFEAKDRPR